MLLTRWHYVQLLGVSRMVVSTVHKKLNEQIRENVKQVVFAKAFAKQHAKAQTFKKRLQGRTTVQTVSGSVRCELGAELHTYTCPRVYPHNCPPPVWPPEVVVWLDHQSSLSFSYYNRDVSVQHSHTTHGRVYTLCIANTYFATSTRRIRCVFYVRIGV